MQRQTRFIEILKKLLRIQNLATLLFASLTRATNAFTHIGEYSLGGQKRSAACSGFVLSSALLKWLIAYSEPFLSLLPLFRIYQL
jgi:hypothetical protein